MGRWMFSTGIKPRPTAWRDPARKSQYLKKNSSPRLNTMDEATAIRAPRSLPRALHRSTSIPWV